ncbi:MAG: NMD protein affecting ribosome stability and mRNA decay [Rhodothermales bacterium]|jgi:NMD protein affecting ribosome stability and mRNA decay
MNTENKCLECGAELEAEGMCPSCLLAAGLESVADGVVVLAG